MTRIRKLAIKSSNWHEFLKEVITWIHWYNHDFPELKSYNKRDLKKFYDKVKGGK